MLVHSPPFPLIIDHIHQFETNHAKVEERILLALKHRDRVLRIRLWMQDTLPERLMEAIDEEFPLLEYLYIRPPDMMVLSPNSALSLPSTLRAPHLRHLVLFNFTFPVGFLLLAGLVTLSLEDIDPSANFGPNELLQQLSFMPHLETFMITFFPPLSNQDGLWQIPLSTQCTLPNLRWFGFEGRSPYMEAVLPRITMPLLRATEIMFRSPHLLNLTSSILYTLRSMYKTENPRFCKLKVMFYVFDIAVVMYYHQQTNMPTLRFRTSWLDFDRTLDFTVRMFDGIRTVLTEVEILTLEDKPSRASPRRFAIQTRWRELLRLFNQVRTLRVSGGGLVEGLSRSLPPQGEEFAIELLPMLNVLSCPQGSRVGELCESFLAARRNSGSPVTISYH
jgi:hypothetical protein